MLEFEAQPTCQRCPLYRESKHTGIPARMLPISVHPLGSPPPAVIFIGRSPGFYENDVGECFVGKAGVLLTDGYAEYAPDDNDPQSIMPALKDICSIYMMLATRCHVNGDEEPGWKLNVVQCSDYMAHDIDLISDAHPRTAIVALGAQASQAALRLVLGQKKMKMADARKLNGITYKFNGKAFQFFVTHPPGFLLHDPNAEFAVTDALRLVYDWANGTLAEPSEPDFQPPRKPR